MRLIYLASPYSKYPYGRQAAFEEACHMAAQLMGRGYAVFCPIAHSHSIEMEAFHSVKDGDWWLKQDFAILEKCDELHVYLMPGCTESYGVKKEIEFAQQRGIPIEYIEYENNRTTATA